MITFARKLDASNPSHVAACLKKARHVHKARTKLARKVSNTFVFTYFPVYIILYILLHILVCTTSYVKPKNATACMRKLKLWTR